MGGCMTNNGSCNNGFKSSSNGGITSKTINGLDVNTRNSKQKKRMKAKTQFESAKYLLSFTKILFNAPQKARSNIINKKEPSWAAQKADIL